MELLAALQKVEERSGLDATDRALMLARQLWDYWLPTQQRNITEGLKSRLAPYRDKSRLDLRTGLQLTPLLYQRPGILRMMEWAELDMDAAMWTIP